MTLGTLRHARAYWFVCLFAPLVGCGSSSSSMGAADAAADQRRAHPTRDASPAEAEASGPSQADAGDASSLKCEPGSISGFKPTYRTPVGPYAEACTVAQVTDAVSSCFGPSSSVSACNAWVDASVNLGCLNCWSGSVTSPIWTPIIYATHGGQEVEIDIGGCVALADPSALSCAQSIEYIRQCELAACLPSCIIPADNDLTAISKCSAEADMGSCSKYAEAAAVCESALATSPAEFCLTAFMSSADLLEFFVLSCGPKSSSDGGPSPMDAGGG
jgi:hypothetical protein